MATRLLTLCLLAAALLLPTRAAAKPPDLPKDSQVDCTPQRYPDGRVMIEQMLFGLHPATALLRLSDVIHCDDDEAFPVIRIGGQEFDTGELLTPSQREEAVPTPAPATETASRTLLEQFYEQLQDEKQVAIRFMMAEVDCGVAERLWGKGPAYKGIVDVGETQKAIDGLRGVNLARCLTEQQLVTFNGRKCQFFAGGEFPVPDMNTAGAAGIKLVPFGVQVSACPTIIDKHRIHLNLEVSLSQRVGECAPGDGLSTPFVTAIKSLSVTSVAELVEGQTSCVCLPISLDAADRALAFFVTMEMVKPLPVTQTGADTTSSCPYVRDHVERKTGPLCPPTPVATDIFENLTKLKQAADFCELAGKCQSNFLASICYESARTLCPGSRFDEMATAQLAQMRGERQSTPVTGSIFITGISVDHQETGKAEESEEPARASTGAGAAVMSAATTAGSRATEVSGEVEPVAKPAVEAASTKRAKVTERDIANRLNLPVSMKCIDTPLRKVVEDLRNWQSINVFLDEAALRAKAISPDVPVSLAVESISMKSALNLLLAQHHLTYVIRDESLVITTEQAARGKLTQKVYSVVDLVVPPGKDGAWVLSREPRQGTAEQQLIRIITDALAPESWSQLGGAGRIEFFPIGLGLVVNQTPDVHERIADLLASLRKQQEEKQQQFDEWIDKCMDALRKEHCVQAQACAAQALAICPKNPLAEMYSKAAETQRLRVENSLESDGLFVTSLADFDRCIQQGRKKDAVGCAEEALRIKPSSALARAALDYAQRDLPPKTFGGSFFEWGCGFSIEEESAAEEQDATSSGGWWSFVTSSLLMPNLYIDVPPTDLILQSSK